MKRAFWIIVVLFVLCGKVNAFERHEAVLPFIGEQLGKLENATGWMKGPGDRWISRENRIPKYLSADYDILQDYERHSLGVYNFDLIELREVSIRDKGYYLLLIHKKGGSYRYPTIREDWYYNYQVRGYVFEKTDLPQMDLADREPTTLTPKLVATPSVVYYNDRYGTAYLNDIALKINEELEKERHHDLSLIINVMKLDDALRFIMVEKSVSTHGKYEFETYSDLYATNQDLPISIEEVVTAEVFRNFYFETDYQAFADLWNR